MPVLLARILDKNVHAGDREVEARVVGANRTLVFATSGNNVTSRLYANARQLGTFATQPRLEDAGMKNWLPLA
eukprot:2600150-Amphidinium_carterae.1